MSIKDRGFASMDKELRTKIAGNGGKKAHALGRAHKWTPTAASKAGKIGGNGRTGRKYKQPRP